MTITPELILAVVNVLLFLLLSGLCWQFWAAHHSEATNIGSLDKLSKLMRDALKEAKDSPPPQAQTPTSDGGSSPSYDQHFSTLAKGLRAHHEETEEQLAQVHLHNSKVENILDGVRDYLSAKNKMTDRLQEGYDFQIIKNFSRQIIRCIHQLDAMIANDPDGSSAKSITALHNDLLDLLDRNGIERFSPEPGTPFSTLRKVAEVLPQKVKTDDKKLSGKVAEVEQPGYRYIFNDNQHRIIQPAQVKIYEIDKGSNE